MEAHSWQGLLQSRCLPISPAPAAGRGAASGNTFSCGEFQNKIPSRAHHGASYPIEPALLTVPHLYSKFRRLFFFFQAKITMQTFKRKTLPKVIFSLDFYLVSCNVWMTHSPPKKFKDKRCRLCDSTQRLLSEFSFSSLPRRPLLFL